VLKFLTPNLSQLQRVELVVKKWNKRRRTQATRKKKNSLSPDDIYAGEKTYSFVPAECAHTHTQKSDTFMPFLNRDSNCSGSMPPLLWNGELFLLLSELKEQRGTAGEELSALCEQLFCHLKYTEGNSNNMNDFLFQLPQISLLTTPPEAFVSNNNFN